MIKKQVKISKLYHPSYADGFEYAICAANGHVIAIMAQKGYKGLENARLIQTILNLELAS